MLGGIYPEFPDRRITVGLRDRQPQAPQGDCRETLHLHSPILLSLGDELPFAGHQALHVVSAKFPAPFARSLQLYRVGAQQASGEMSLRRNYREGFDRRK
jgi:hypothetical protein